MEVIDKETYEKAKENMRLLQTWIRESEDQIAKLIDGIIDEKAALDGYKSTLESNKLIILTYEAQQEVKGEK